MAVMRSVVASFLVLFTMASFIPARGSDRLDYIYLNKRNIFRPLWSVSSVTKEDKSRKEELEALKKAEEERQQLQKAAEEQNALKNKLNEIEQNYALTGIVFENGKKQAVVQDKKGAAHFLYENGFMDDLKVVSIDDTKGEIVLDYQGKCTVTLHME